MAFTWTAAHRILIEQNIIHNVDFGIELASEHQNRATSLTSRRGTILFITPIPRAFPSEAMRRSEGALTTAR